LFEEIIKTQNVSINNLNTKGLNHKMKLFLPILFIILYVILYNFIVLYKKQMNRIKK
jgi:hypothetical protein